MVRKVVKKAGSQKITETQLVKQIIQYLNYSGHFVWRSNTGSVTSSYKDKAGRTKSRFIRFGFKGVSDIIGISKNGTMIAIEAKVGYNKPTQFQKDFLESVKDRGGIAIVAYCLEDVQSII